MSSGDEETRAIMDAMSLFFWRTPKRKQHEQAEEDEAAVRALTKRRLEECQPAAMREWQRSNVAIAAMEALLPRHSGDHASLAVIAYDIAEAMMMEREKRAAAEKTEPGGGNAA